MSEEQQLNLSRCGYNGTTVVDDNGLIFEEIILQSKNDAALRYSYIGGGEIEEMKIDMELTFDNSEENSNSLFWDNE